MNKQRCTCANEYKINSLTVHDNLMKMWSYKVDAWQRFKPRRVKKKQLTFWTTRDAEPRLGVGSASIRLCVFYTYIL